LYINRLVFKEREKKKLEKILWKEINSKKEEFITIQSVLDNADKEKAANDLA